MTRDDIISMARKAGIGQLTISEIEFREGRLTKFASLIAAAEREACAEVCENLYYGLRIQPTRSECAEAIRARGRQ